MNNFFIEGENAYSINQKLLKIIDKTENISFNNIISHQQGNIEENILNPALYLWKHPTINTQSFDIQNAMLLGNENKYKTFYYSKNLGTLKKPTLYLLLLSPNKTNYLFKKIIIKTEGILSWNLNLTINNAGLRSKAPIGYSSSDKLKYQQKSYYYSAKDWDKGRTWFTLYKTIEFPNNFENGGFSSKDYEYSNEKTYYTDENDIVHYFRTPIFPGYWIQGAEENLYDYPIIFSVEDKTFTSFQGNEINQTNKIFLNENQKIVFGEVTDLTSLPHCTIWYEGE